MSVPRTAFESAASAATTSVSLSAATASGADTLRQKPDQPSCFDCQRSAAIGSATTTSRNVEAKPSEKAAPAFSLDRCWMMLRPCRRASLGVAGQLDGPPTADSMPYIRPLG